MDMTITKQQRDLLIGLGGVLLAIVIWFLVATPYKEKADALKADNAALRPKVEEYQAVHARVEEYQNELTVLQNEEAQILSHFPSDIQREDQIMLWSNIDKQYPLDLAFGDLELGDWDTVAIAGVEEGSVNGGEITYDEEGNPQVSDAVANAATADYKLYAGIMTMEFASTYEGLKDMFRYIQSQNDKNSIDAFEVEYDVETGLLHGGVGVKQYFIVGTDKEYVPSFIPSVPTGVSDIFHTGDATVDHPDNEVSEEAEEATEE